jgi:CheY-like chemotaxis protein
MARILIADDNDLARRTISGLVESQSLRVCAEARNGKDAVDMARALQPDLVILDLFMPQMDGLQAAREILRARPSVPVLLVTLFFTDHLRAAAREVGIRQVVAKTDYQSLVDALKAFREATPLHTDGPSRTGR